MVQRATQTAIWAMPAVVMVDFIKATRSDLGGTINDVVFLTKPFDSKHGFLTANDVTAYSWGSMSSAKGPIVIEVPPASNKVSYFGTIVNAWSQPIEDVGPTGADKGKGGKYLLLPPDFNGRVPSEGFYVYPTDTYEYGFSFRPRLYNGATDADAAEYAQQIKIYYLADNANAPATNYLDATPVPYDSLPAYDHTFFEDINNVIQNNPIRPQDKVMVSLLKSLGIEKGKAFNPTEEQKRAMNDGLKLAYESMQSYFTTPGKAMIPLWKGKSDWQIWNFAPGQAQAGFPYETENTVLIDERAGGSYFWITYLPKYLGGSTFYLTGLRDSNGNLLNGEDTYKLNVPQDTPAKDFWSAIVYSMKTKGFVRDAERVGLSSRNIDTMQVNEDGSYDIYFAPEAPAGKKANWIPTGEDFFLLFRLYGPESKDFYKTWQLGDVVKVAISLPAMAEPKYKADVPKSITTPDSFKSQYAGDLKFIDGFPTDETVANVYDYLDTARAVELFLNGLPTSSMYAMLNGHAEIGFKPNKTVGITEQLMDARSLWLTAQTTTPYVHTEINVKEEPVVIELDSPVIGLINDAYFKYVADIGLGGQDKGKGGKYLLVGPDFEGDIPEGYFVLKTNTYRHWLLMRIAIQKGESQKQAIDKFKSGYKAYPLSQANKPKANEFINLSGKKYNTIHANDAHFYNELNEVIQYEPATSGDPELLGLAAAVGIKKGQPFKPDARMQKILEEAAAIANASSRAILFRPRNKDVFFYEDRQWFSPLAGGSHEFLNNGERVLDDRIAFHYYATGITPFMVQPKVGSGSVYEIGATDKIGDPLDGSKNYTVTLPAPIPAKNFWSFMVYDNHTRSILETDQESGGLDSNANGFKYNKDKSATVYFGPIAPKGKEGNWVQTMPGKGFNVLLRIYGPEQAWLDKTWKPGDFELVE